LFKGEKRKAGEYVIKGRENWEKALVLEGYERGKYDLKISIYSCYVD
jgi:hypothetical protein